MSVLVAVAAGSGPGAKGEEAAEAPGPLELCGACRERLSPQREPRLLPCLHSVCRGCLGAAPGAAGGDGNVFQCPVCHQQCPLGDIVENFFLQDSGAGPAPGQHRGQSCTSCEDNAAATGFCVECAEPLCDTCVEAHLRVRYTREHSVQPLVPVADPAVIPDDPGPCPWHPGVPLSLFCGACDTLSCARCHQGTHRGHPSQRVPDAVLQHRSALSSLQQRLAERHGALQRCSRQLRMAVRRSAEAQQRLQVEVKMATLQVMKELNKRGRALLGELQRAAQGHQERLERQQRALGRALRLQEHVLGFTGRALETGHGTALLRCTRMIHSQLLRALGVTVEPPEPPAELKFQWDPQEWSRRAQSFGAIIWERPLPPSLSPPPAASPRDPSPASQCHPQVAGGGQVTPELLLGEPPWAPPPECPPELSPPHLEPAETPEPGGDTLGTRGHGGDTALRWPLSPVTGTAERGEDRRRNPGNSPREEKFVKKLLIKRRGPPGAQGSPRLPKVPRVSLERLELDLELDPAQPPVFRIFPGPSAEEFSVIVIEQGTAEGTAEGTADTAQPHGALPVKEEQQESPIGDIGDIGDTKPVGLPPPPLGEPGPALGPSPDPGLPLGVPGGVPGVLPGGVPGVSCCRVCGQAGAVVMCDRCQRCFHLHCHLPALQDVPSPEWTCLLCQDLPPPSPAPEQGSPLKLSPHDQQRCEFVLLQLLCHEPCRPLQRLSGSSEGGSAMDLTLMRARLQGKLSPGYGSAREFARDGARLLRQFHRLTEDKADVQSILELQQFLESRLCAVFGDQKFSRLLVDPEDSLEASPGC